MARGKKKVKAKRVVKKTKAKAKRKIVPKKNFQARAPMAGVLCIKLQPGGSRLLIEKACIVKRLTSEVKASADAGEIIAISLKTNQVILGGEAFNAKEQRFDHFLHGVELEVVTAATPTLVKESGHTEDVEDEIPSHSNGLDHAPAAMAAEGAQPSI